MASEIQQPARPPRCKPAVGAAAPRKCPAYERLGAAGEANGDAINDFAGNGAAAGDSLQFLGFGSAAQGATFTQLNATRWQIHSGLDGHNEVITLQNAAAVDASDFIFA